MGQGGSPWKGGTGWKKGEGGQTWRCRWFQWQERWTGKEAGGEDEQCHNCSKNHYLPEFNCVTQTYIKLRVVKHNSFYTICHVFCFALLGGFFPITDILSVPLCGAHLVHLPTNTYQGNLLGHTCTNSNTSLSFPGSAHVTPYSAS